jgi:enoyl-CoA hydratase/carnithine racemase
LLNHLLVERDGPLARVTINRAANRNAMTLAMWRQMADEFSDLGRDKAVRAILLTGAGDDFSTGADIAEFEAVRSDAAQSTAYEVAVDACSDAIESAPKPTIAVIQGYCLGGGCHLAMACDFRYAAKSTKIGIPAARLSIIYGVRSTQRLLALVGLTNAKRILYSGERLDADAALAAGLIDDVSADAMASATSFARSIAHNAPLSIAGAKRILTDTAMGKGLLDLDAAQQMIERASNSFDYREGRSAFAEKRPPAFRGE